MGILDRWLGRARTAFEDRLWRTEADKWDAVSESASGHLAEGTSGLVVYHFPATGRMLAERLARDGIRCDAPGVLDVRTIGSRTGVTVVSSEAIPDPALIAAVAPAGAECEMTVHLCERFPVPHRDERVLSLAPALPSGTAFIAYASLEEPWIRSILAGGSVAELLDRLGMDAGECISHPMVGRSLRHVQERLETKRRQIEQRADSCEEWMAVNLDLG